MKTTGTGPLQEALRRMRGMLLAPQIVLMVVGVILAYGLIFVGELVVIKAFGIRTNGSVLAFIMGFLIATFLCVVMYISIVFTGDEDSGNSSLSIIEIPHLRAAVGCC
jgi:hypothetical protein